MCAVYMCGCVVYVSDIHFLSLVDVNDYFHMS